VIDAEGSPFIGSSIRFVNSYYCLELTQEGIAISLPTYLSMHGVKDALAVIWTMQQTGFLYIAWKDIQEWIVETDSDGPDYYALTLISKGQIKVRRFVPDNALESDILDAVRSIGKRTLRLMCDVEDAPQG
jgi:hypothetical protein